MASWLASFTAAPAPAGPAWTTSAASAVRTGRTRASAAAGPPTMMVNVPAAARSAPPLTGASRTSTRPAARSVSDCAVRGRIVLWISTVAASGSRSSSPPRTSTSSTAASSGTASATTSQSARSAGSPATVAPARRSSSVRSGRGSRTVSGNPAPRRQRAIGAPMLPSPAKPTFILGLPYRCGSAHRVVELPAELLVHAAPAGLVVLVLLPRVPGDLLGVLQRHHDDPVAVGDHDVAGAHLHPADYHRDVVRVVLHPALGHALVE